MKKLHPKLEAKLAGAIKAKKDAGLYKEIKSLDGPQGPWVMIDGKKMLNLCSNNFLNLGNHPKVADAAIAGIKKFGCGPGAVRAISGTSKVHIEFEKALAKYKGVEATLLVQSGFNTNTALIPTLFGKGDALISDQLNHASIIDGMKLAGKVTKYVFLNNNMKDLEEKLIAADANPDVTGFKVIITDGVFSMDGVISNLPAITDLAEKYDALVYVDDAWGEFALGKTGKGTAEYYGLEHKIDLEVGTLSKGFGLSGGFISGSKLMIDYLKQAARPFLFSTGINLSNCAAGIETLKIIQNDSSMLKNLWKNVDYMKAGLKKIGLKADSPSHIIPVMIGDEQKTQDMTKLLNEAGIYMSAIVFPTVPKGTGRCRINLSSGHTIKDLDWALKIIEKSAKKLEII